MNAAPSDPADEFAPPPPFDPAANDTSASADTPGVGSTIPRCRMPTTSTAQNATSSDPLMNCTYVVLTIPAVTTIRITSPPTISTPQAWAIPSSGVTSDPAPTICGIR